VLLLMLMLPAIRRSCCKEMEMRRVFGLRLRLRLVLSVYGPCSCGFWAFCAKTFALP